MAKVLFPLVCITMLVACARDPEQAPVASAQESAPGEMTGQIVSGEDAYVEYCAVCHETGMLGAPIVGDPATWESRSHLWQAVLMEHAKTGYLDMPAKGSRPEISDATAAAAAEYMLESTFTDMPPD